MLSYDYDGSVLTLILRGTPSELQRAITYNEIVRDDRVPEASLVLIDIRRADDADGPQEVERRARILTQGLGPKLGAACAVIAPPRLAESAEQFQAMGRRLGVRIELFRDEPDARQWLATFR
ncbi:MAG TPA: hypothetical protein VN700_02195 [Vicinamibacterales bacterium]|nr:hypothetical protein [Vicinamibacterales bacterium]